MTNKERAAVDQLTSVYKENYTPDLDLGLERLKRRIDHTPLQKKRVNKRRFILAAAVLGLLLSSFAIWSLNTERGNVFVTRSDTKSVLLPDGTKVLLNKNSRLSFSENDYGKSNRTIELEGEAFFDVEPNKQAPFLVQRDGVEMKVVGTSFNLKITPNRLFEVEVATGKVLLSVEGDRIAVAAKQCGRFTPKEGLMNQPAPNLNHHAWRTGEIIFKETPLSEALEVVSRAYDIQLLAKSTDLQKCDFPCTATFKNDTLEEVLEVFERLSGGDIIREGNSNIYRLVNWCVVG